MPNNFASPTEWYDCAEHGLGSGAELLIVEGDSAAKSVCRLRNIQLQAVLPMQGKPLNAYKASAAAVKKSPLYQTLLGALGCDDLAPPAKLRFDRIVLLFDPDADGIHIGALMLLFFYRWLQPLMADGHLHMIRAPLFEIATADRSKVQLGYNEEEYRKLCAEHGDATDLKKQRYRGLGSINDDVLYRSCVNVQTRTIHRLTIADAEAARRAFGGKAVFNN